MLSERALVALTRRFQASLATVADRTAFSMALSWQHLGSYDESDIVRYVRATSQATGAAKRATVRLSSAFYSSLGSVPPAGINAARVAVEVPSRDPFIAYWRGLKTGSSWLDAVAAGRSRAEAVGADFVHSTSRRTGDVVAEATGQRVVGWRRVLTGNACEWCALVATQRYHSSESADFGHQRCDCSAVPIYGTRDPGRAINRSVVDTLDD